MVSLSIRISLPQNMFPLSKEKLFNDWMIHSGMIIYFHYERIYLTMHYDNKAILTHRSIIAGKESTDLNYILSILKGEIRSMFKTFNRNGE